MTVQWPIFHLGTFCAPNKRLSSQYRFASLHASHKSRLILFGEQVGQTKVSYPKDFEDSLRKSVRSSHDVLSSIIQDEYAPTKDWNEAFYAKGQVRHDLGNHARFGNLTEDHIGILRSALNEFLKVRKRIESCYAVCETEAS